ncbi:MAG: DUF2846 domain-containing protein [Agriterribacter sp.]
MKQLKFQLAILLALWCLGTQAQDSTQVSKIYFLRSTGYNGSLLTFHCFIDSGMVCKLKNNQYSLHTVPPGEHRLDVTAHSKELKNDNQSLKISTVAGQSYYIKILPAKGYNNKVKLLSVSENTIRPVMAKCEPQTNCLE